MKTFLYRNTNRSFVCNINECEFWIEVIQLITLIDPSISEKYSVIVVRDCLSRLNYRISHYEYFYCENFMKKSNIKSHSFVIINNELCESDKKYIRRTLGYASSKIYDCPYKYCHQNFANRKKTNN